MTIGKRISNLRKERSYSQEYVAEKLNVSRQAVSKWEQDQCAPDTYNLIALAELFGVSVEYIAVGQRDKSEISEEKSVHSDNKDVLSVRKIIGLILLGAGLLSLILGALFSVLLLGISLYLLVGGILCLTVSKRVWLVIMWTYLGITLLLILIMSIPDILYLLGGESATQGVAISMGGLVLLIFLAFVIIAVIVTIVLLLKAKKNNRKK